jgi:hypothetical protein
MAADVAATEQTGESATRATTVAAEEATEADETRGEAGAPAGASSSSAAAAEETRRESDVSEGEERPTAVAVKKKKRTKKKREDDEALIDPRTVVELDVETAREAIASIRNLDDEVERLVSVKVYCQKRRIGARRALAEAQREYEVALGEYRSVICDKYLSTVASSVQRAERELEYKEHVLANRKREAGFFDFGDGSARNLAKALKRNKTLERLLLVRNDIGPVGAEPLALLLRKSAVIRELDLHDNPLGEDGAASLAAILGDCESLTSLDVRGCKLGAKGAETVARAAGAHKGLLKLGLRNNRLGQAGCTAVAELVVQPNGPLRELDLATNDIGFGQALLVLCKALQDNKTLMRIDLSHNNLLMALRRPENRQVYLALRKERIIGVRT